MRRTAARRAAGVVLAAVALAAGPGAGVARADDGESVTSFDSAIVVDARGDLHVTETVEYAFAGTPRHGLRRELPTRVGEPRGDGLPSVSDIRTSSPTGAPAHATVADTGARTVVQVGDPRRTVSGRHTYVLQYTVHGAFRRFVAPLRDGAGAEAPARYDRLHWNATGDEWDVPIDRVSVRVTAPRPASAGWCSGSRPGSSPRCPDVTGPVSTFAVDDLRPGQGLLFTLLYPGGTVTDPGPTPAGGGPTAAPSAGAHSASWEVGTFLHVALLVAAGAILLIAAAARTAGPPGRHRSDGSGGSDSDGSDGSDGFSGGGGSSGGGSSWGGFAGGGFSGGGFSDSGGGGGGGGGGGSSW